jgi:hypothetical protein
MNLSITKDSLAWLASSVTVVTALFYGFGFIIIQTHLNLLGVAHLVDVPNKDYLITGGLFFVYFPFFTAVSLLIYSPLVFAAFFTSKIRSIPHWVILAVIITFCAGLLVYWVQVFIPPFGLLSDKPTDPSNLIHGLIIEGEEKRKYLLLIYSLAVGITTLFVFFLIRCWNWKLTTKAEHILRIFVTVLVCMQIFLAPINFGLLVVQTKYPRISIQVDDGKLSSVYDGWMLNRNLSNKDEPLVFFSSNITSDNPNKLLLIRKDLIRNTKIIGNRFIFPLQQPAKVEAGNEREKTQ